MRRFDTECADVAQGRPSTLAIRQELTFRTWLQKARVTRTPCGDFIADARADTDLPDIKDRKELVEYLHACGACHAALLAAKSVWRSYLKACRRRSKSEA